MVKLLRSYYPSIASVLLMCMVLYLIYPDYQYYIDPDGTAYLTVSQRYANGDYLRAINGYWSPWSCWLTALLIRGGAAAIPASVIVNTVGAIGFLCVAQSLFLLFAIGRRLQWLMNLSLVVFLCYAIFAQSFDDLWECFFLLSVLRLELARQFLNKPLLWLLCGLAGTLAYFAKAYSFPFFILNTACSIFIIAKVRGGKWLVPALVAIGTMVVCSLPWIYVLHQKYGVWTTSTAGSLNMSWYLVGHPYWKEHVGLLLPPPYPDSPYYWEDPWFANGKTPHFWDSASLLALQLVRATVNLGKLFVSLLQLSFFAPVVIARVAGLMLRSRTQWRETPARAVLVATVMLFPLGYVLINFEPRYLWYLLPLTMIMASELVRAMFHRRYWFIGGFVLALSYIVVPVRGLFKMRGEGKVEYEASRQLQRAHVRGTFASKALPGLSAQRTARLAYFSNSTCYLNWTNLSAQDLAREMVSDGVRYYVAFSGSPSSYEPVDSLLKMNVITPVGAFKSGNLKVYRVTGVK